MDEPIYGKGIDGIKWKIPEYSRLWNTLHVELKSVLRPDNEWLKAFMFNCVNKKANGQLCKFLAPNNLALLFNSFSQISL